MGCQSEPVEDCGKIYLVMKTMYVYILECADGSYYTGVTNDLESRFQIHQQGINRNCYTFFKRPLKIVYYEIFNDPNTAIAFEKKIKGWNRKKRSLNFRQI